MRPLPRRWGGYLPHQAHLFCAGRRITGIVSGVLYLHNIFIQPFSAFGIDWTVRLVFITIIGGSARSRTDYRSLHLCLPAAMAVGIPQCQFAHSGGDCHRRHSGCPKGIMGTIQERLGLKSSRPTQVAWQVTIQGPRRITGKNIRNRKEKEMEIEKKTSKKHRLEN